MDITRAAILQDALLQRALSVPIVAMIQGPGGCRGRDSTAAMVWDEQWYDDNLTARLGSRGSMCTDIP